MLLRIRLLYIRYILIYRLIDMFFNLCFFLSWNSIYSFGVSFCNYIMSLIIKKLYKIRYLEEINSNLFFVLL